MALISIFCVGLSGLIGPSLPFVLGTGVNLEWVFVFMGHVLTAVAGFLWYPGAVTKFQDFSHQTGMYELLLGLVCCYLSEPIGQSLCFALRAEACVAKHTDTKYELIVLAIGMVLFCVGLFRHRRGDR